MNKTIYIGNADLSKFRRQFLLSSTATKRFPLWKHAEISGNYYLEVHPDLEMTQAGENGVQLVLLGFMIDPDQPRGTNESILKRLLLTGGNLPLLLEWASGISGRWILIASNRNRTVLFNDAAGLRSVYYTDPETEPFICASQPGLIAPVLNRSYSAMGKAFINSPYFRKNREYWWPGGCSLHEGIYHLLPNHYLDLRTAETKRFWPMAPIRPMPLKEAVAKSADRLKNLVECGARRFEIALPITAGLDSRALLASTVDISKDVYYYTLMYWRLNEKSPDIRIPKRLAASLGLKHHVINCLSPMDQAFRKTYMNSVADAHETWGDIAFGLSREFPRRKVCMKGNVSEIARSSVYFNIKYPDVINGQVLAGMAGMAELPWAGRIFDAWLAQTREIAEACHIDILDLFYWEHKMGVWQAMSQLEWDSVQETYTPFNCRELLCTLLAVDIKYRKETRYILYEEIIRALWPETLREPVNPLPFKAMRHSFKVALKHIGVDRLMKRMAF